MILLLPDTLNFHTYRRVHPLNQAITLDFMTSEKDLETDPARMLVNERFLPFANLTKSFKVLCDLKLIISF